MEHCLGIGTLGHPVSATEPTTATFMGSNRSSKLQICERRLNVCPLEHPIWTHTKGTNALWAHPANLQDAAFV